MTDSLYHRLADYAAGPALPFHMPGHKRRPLHSPALPWALDITEIDGFDDLHAPTGPLLEAMERSARLWGSQRAFLLVNGSTGGILAALHALLPRGSTLLMARNCHKSVYHGVELLGLEPVFLQPPVDPHSGVAASLPVQAVRDALDAHPQARALLLTSPTYDGVLSDVAGLCDLCHSRAIPVLVDEAHGAHLGFPPFPKGAVACGADVVIQSLHKTLPSLTQTALLHVQGPLADPARLARSLGIFQSSSPSYPLMASIDGCLRLLEADSGLLERWFALLEQFDLGARALKHLKVLCHGGDPLARHPAFFDFEPSKLVLSTREAGLSGPALMEWLRRDYHIELEMAAPTYATAMTGAGEDAAALSALLDALLDIDSSLTPSAPAPVLPAPEVPERALPAARALELPAQGLSPRQAVGRVAAQYLWAYPPGIPLLVPGEVVPPVFPDLCAAYAAAGVPLNFAGAGQTLSVCRL